MKRKVFTLCLLALAGAKAVAGTEKTVVKSPGGIIGITVETGGRITYTVSHKDVPVLFSGELSMECNGAKFGYDPKLTSSKVIAVSEVVEPVVPMKFSQIENRYNLLTMKFRGGYSVEFRVYDDGVAYRFITAQKNLQDVFGEDFHLSFPQECAAHLQPAHDLYTSYEAAYLHTSLKDWQNGEQLYTLPALLETAGRKVFICESDLRDYPCMFIRGGNGTINSFFPKAPLETELRGDRRMHITKEAGYIARTEGSRTFPWRYMVITDDDRRLVENTMPAKLAGKCEIDDTSWIRPGQVSWEWWNGAIVWGEDVDFKSGFNFDTYKYFIDFASKNNIPYIIMDEGWAATTMDPYIPNPTIDIHKLIAYGKEKNVGIILWLTWYAVENHMELFETFAEWGVKGVKIDFMDRSDQWMVNYYERVVKEAAKHKIIVDFHGSFKPAGLEYRYPNLIAYEGVRGLEQMGGCHPDNTVWLPFIRNIAGAMDFTPGAMVNMQPEVYHGRRPHAGGMGTRAYQMALFVLFESGLQMLADSPTNYMNNQECTDFITSVPVTWDETRALVAEAGRVAIVAKRKGEKWYVGGITQNDGYKVTVPLDFLPEWRNYTMTGFADNANSARMGVDYRKERRVVVATDEIEVDMCRNGGWAAVFE